MFPATRPLRTSCVRRWNNIQGACVIKAHAKRGGQAHHYFLGVRPALTRRMLRSLLLDGGLALLPPETI